MISIALWCVQLLNDTEEDWSYVQECEKKLISTYSLKRFLSRALIAILSICQDLLWAVSNGRQETPKHIGLAMTVKHSTDSKQLISI